MLTDLRLPRRPVIIYGPIIELTYPQKLWSYESQLQGGSRVFSSGTVESFDIREDNRAVTTLRVHDCEYLEVRAWILDAMFGNEFEFQFDRDDPDSVFLCVLENPRIEDGFEPHRSEWPSIWEVDVTIRTVDGRPIYVSSSGDCGATGGVSS